MSAIPRRAGPGGASCCAASGRGPAVGAARRMGEPGLVRLAAYLGVAVWAAGGLVVGVCWLRGVWFGGEQVDAVAGGQDDAGVGVAEGVVIQDGDRDPAGRPGGVGECLAGGGRAGGDGDLQDLVAGQRGRRRAGGGLRDGDGQAAARVPAGRRGRRACGGRRPAARSGW